VRVATSGIPGPVVLVIPEDIQQQPVTLPKYRVSEQTFGLPPRSVLDEIAHRLRQAERPIIVAGGQFDRPGGRDALHDFAHHWHIPVMVSFRRHDIFPNDDTLYAGDLGLSIPDVQMQMLQSSDFILALGTRLGDITTQNYQFPPYSQSKQTFLHCYPDSRLIGWDTAADYALVCDPVALVKDLMLSPAPKPDAVKQQWITSLRNHALQWSAWPNKEPTKGVNFTDVVRSLREQIDENTTVCLDAGTFAAPVYRYFNFVRGQRLMAPLAGAMGYGTPAALACAMRDPSRKVICMVGDGGFMMTGNEMILAVQRQLPIVFIVANNGSYASIRLHQERTYPGRVSGTSLFNPDFHDLAISFGMKALRLHRKEDIQTTLKQALALQEPVLIDVNTSLDAVLP
jgi:acetolactate synthase-1/2/3 large subunit